MTKRRLADRWGYKTFSLIGIILILVGVLMTILKYTASSEIGLKYGPSEGSGISGYQLIILGTLLLLGILVFHLSSNQRNKK